MRTSQVAAEAGGNAETLRYYERRGLLREPLRSESGYRTYPSDTVATVRFIKEPQKLGFTLTEIETLLHLGRGGPADCDAVRVFAVEKLRDLQSRIGSLTTMRDSLEQLIATCERPLPKRVCPLIKALGGIPDKSSFASLASPSTPANREPKGWGRS